MEEKEINKEDINPINLNGDRPDMSIPYSFMHFKDFNSFEKRMNEIMSEASSGFLNAKEDLKKQFDSQIRNNPTWYGEHYPLSYEQGLKREDFLYNEKYLAFKKKADTFLYDLLNKRSFADLLTDKYVYNDRELGTFSFDMASLGLKPRLVYFSKKHKKEVDVEDIKTVVKNDVTTYFYKLDNSPIQLSYKVILNEGGEKFIPVKKGEDLDIEEINKIGRLDLYSDVKNSYVYKQKKIKPANAIRLFVQTDANGNINSDVYMYNGFLAGVLAQFFELFGYKTSIIVLFGNVRNDYNQSGTVPIKGGRGIRWASYEAKSWNENLFLNKFLYTAVDPSYLRIKTFLYSHVLSEYYKDSFAPYIGGAPNLSQCLGTVMRYFKNADKQQQVLYYVVQLPFGLSPTVEEMENLALSRIKELVLNVEEENRKLREKMQLEIYNQNK